MASLQLAKGELPEVGDHLWIHKKGYTHHGLYIGESDQGDGLVVHYAGWVDGFRAGKLELTDIDTFSGGKTIHIRHYRERTYDREDTQLRALSRLGEDDYSVHANNCEHFCHWAIMGEARSKQVEWVDTVLGAIHPGLEAARKGFSALNAPPYERTEKRKAFSKIAKSLAVDWGLKSAARWAAGPVGVAAYVGYRVSKQLLARKH